MEQAEVERLLMKPTARRRLGKYTLLGRLGHGGMGKIYLAYHPGPAGIEKLLVIKRLHSHLTNDKVLVSSFLDEARLSMALNHPNIVHTYDVGEVEGRYFMVMEHIDGQNLGVLLRTAKRSGDYPTSDTWAGLFMQVLEGLHAAHEAHDARGRRLNIIHRDVSPQNILVTYDGTPKLVDFGIAKAAMRINETDAGVLKGKYAYMSPEQCEGHDLDPRSDVFSAGIVLWEMLAGRRLYKSDSVLRSVERILHEPPISPVKVNGDCDPELARVVLKALQKKTAHRFKSAEDFRDALEEVLRRQNSRFKKATVRELMHTCFSDVMRRQREVLDRCMAGDIPTDDSGDSESGHKATFEGDSRSDLAVPAIGISVDMEPTTPSSVQPSPLVTQDGDSHDGAHLAAMGTIAATRQDRPEPPLAPDAATAAFESPIGGVPQKRSRLPLAAALFIFLILGGLMAAFVTGAADPLLAELTGKGAGAGSGAAGDRLGDGADSPTNRTALKPAEELEQGNSATSAGTGTPKVGGEQREAAAGTEEPPSGDAVPSTQKEAARSEGSGDDDTRPGKDRAGLDDDVGEAEASDRGETNRADKKRRKTRERRRARRSKRDEPRVAKASDSEPTPPKAADNRPGADPESEPKSGSKADVAERKTSDTPNPRRADAAQKANRRAETASKRATGFLTLDTSPWVTVYLKGKKLGNTPLVNLPVPAGELTLTLKNPGEGISKEYFVVVKPGKTVRKRLGLK